MSNKQIERIEELLLESAEKLTKRETTAAEAEALAAVACALAQVSTC